MIEALPVLVVRYPALLPASTAFIADAALVRAARRSDEPLTFAAFIRQDVFDEPAAAARLMRVGCAAVVEEVVTRRGQLLGVRVRGLARVERIGELEHDGGLPRAQVRVLDAPTEADDLLRAQLARVRARLHDLGPRSDAAVRAALATLADPGHFADLLAAQLDDLTLDERLALLTTSEPAARLVLVERLLAARTPAAPRELGRVWAALRGPCNAVPGQASLGARARDIDRGALLDPRLRRAVEDMARSEPILVVELADSREQQYRRESLSQLTSAIRSLTALRACGRGDEPDDVAVQAEIEATIAFLFVVADREHAAIAAARPA